MSVCEPRRNHDLATGSAPFGQVDLKQPRQAEAERNDSGNLPGDWDVLVHRSPSGRPQPKPEAEKDRFINRNRGRQPSEKRKPRYGDQS
jgi:hypothetical protein